VPSSGESIDSALEAISKPRFQPTEAHLQLPHAAIVANGLPSMLVRRALAKACEGGIGAITHWLTNQVKRQGTQAIQSSGGSTGSALEIISGKRTPPFKLTEAQLKLLHAAVFPTDFLLYQSEKRWRKPAGVILKSCTAGLPAIGTRRLFLSGRWRRRLHPPKELEAFTV
jgi:hypothetical protein